MYRTVSVGSGVDIPQMHTFATQLYGKMISELTQLRYRSEKERTKRVKPHAESDHHQLPLPSQ